LLRRSRDRLGTTNESITTALEVRRLLNGLEKHCATENRYENHMEQKGDREIS
jgi:hypothetical protein